MANFYEDTLIDYLDNKLEGQARLDAEKLIREDASAAAELESLRISAELVREAAVLDQVSAVRKDFQSAGKVVNMPQQSGGAVVRPFFRSALRVAAMVFLLVGAGSVYKYSTVTSSSLLDNNLASYELSTSRGENNDGELEKAYRSKDWSSVKNLFSQLHQRTSKSWFLSGMAELELKNYSNAVTSFNEVLNLNKTAAEPAFQDEAEYYLGIGYIGAKKVNEGVAILRKIRADKNHLFYQKASSISSIDLQVLEIKY